MPMITLSRRVEAVRQRLCNPLAARPLLSLYLYALVGLTLLGMATYMILIIGRLGTRPDTMAYTKLIATLRVLMYAMHFAAHTFLLLFLYKANVHQPRYLARVNAMAYSAAALSGRHTFADRKEMRLGGGAYMDNDDNNNNNSGDVYKNGENKDGEEDRAYKQHYNNSKHFGEGDNAMHEHVRENGMASYEQVRQKNAFVNGSHVALRRRGVDVDVEMLGTSPPLPALQLQSQTPALKENNHHAIERVASGGTAASLLMRRGTSSTSSSALSATLTTTTTGENVPHGIMTGSVQVRKLHHDGHACSGVMNELDEDTIVFEGDEERDEAGRTGPLRYRIHDTTWCCCCCCCSYFFANYCGCFSYLGNALHRWGHRWLPARVMTVVVRYGPWLWLVVPLYFLFVPYLIASHIVAPRYALTFGILTVSAQCLLNGLLAFATLITLVVLSVRLSFAYASRYGRRGVLFKRAAWCVFCLLLLYFSCSTIALVQRVRRVDTLAELRRGILSDHVDPCAAEGAQLDPMLRHSWVWPAITPRRLFNFFTGSETCHDESWRPMAYVDADSDVLLVSAHCADGTTPRIFYDRPERSELSGKATAFISESKRANAQYQRELEDLYGSDALANEAGVIVHRDTLDGHIMAVELNPTRLQPTQRSPRTFVEATVRAEWPSPNDVLQIELGHSAAYSVWCEASNYEEYFVYPLTLAPITSNTTTTSAPSASSSSSDASSSAAQDVRQATHSPPSPTAIEPVLDEPASNLLFIVFDAVSRQSVARMLPKFTAWMRAFQAGQRAKPATQHGYYVIEAEAHTTMGHSTAGNFVPYLTGTSGGSSSTEPNSTNRFEAMRRNVFNLAKERYGERISTAFTTGYCADFFETMFHNTVPSSGRGGRIRGIDRYLFQPFCHLEYTAKESILQGQYSILRRCIDYRYVHEHILDYTANLLKQNMRTRNGSTEYFFDLSYFMEGHEGTHGVLPLVDEALAAFMQRLQSELGFFDNPRNAFIFAADHGNHMGHYYELTKAGQFERTTPAMVYIIHPEVMRRIDAQKRQPAGTAEANFLARTKRLATPGDLYLTLCDLFNVVGQPNEKSATLALPPASLFDRRQDDKFVTSCKAFKFSDDDDSPCSLTYCVPRETSGV